MERLPCRLSRARRGLARHWRPRAFGSALPAALLALGGGLAAPAAAQGTPRRTDLVVLATTDVHGRLRGWDYVANRPDPARSLAGAATIVDSVRRAHPGRVVLVDAGDLLQGNPLTFVAARVAPTPVHPVMAAMNTMRYDAAVLGNHEFNYGVPLLRRALGQAGFPFLAANVRDAKGRPWVPGSTLVERAGVRVGIVGGTTPGSMIWDQANLAAAGLTVGDILPAVRAEAASLRRRGADVVVALLHSGLDGAASYDTVATGLPSENVAARVAREVPGVDLVVFGHSHGEVVDTTVGGALLVQPRNWAASVAVATLTLERQGRRWRVAERRGSSVRVAGHAEHPDVLAATARTHAAAVAWATAPVARAMVAWRGDSARVADLPLTDFVAEVMRRETGAELAATAAFSLDAGFAAGPVTLAEFARLYPYDNTLRAVRITGAQLRAFLEHAARYYRTLGPGDAVPAGGIVDPRVPGYNFDVVSGASYTLDLRRPVGQRVTRLAVRGRAVQDADQFTLALNNYRAGGGGGYAMLAGAPVVYQQDVDIRQLLIDEARRVGTLDLSAYAERNWTLEPAAAVAAAYREQRRGAGAEAAGTAAATGAPAGAAAGAAPTGRTVRVIAMSDFHATLAPRQEGARRTGGAVALSAAIEQARRECTGGCQSVVVDAGDLFTGSPASDWDAGRPTVAVMNRLHVVAGALGNHEFDFGQDTLRQRVAELGYRVLGANVLGPDGTRPGWLRADTLVERGGVRIGIVGTAGTHTPNTTKLRNVRGLRFADPAPVISERVRALRAAGAQVVVSVIHDGARCERDRPAQCQGEGLEVAARLTARPDLFVMGHAHVNLTTTVNGMPVVEPTSNGRAIVVVDLPLEGGAPVVSVRPVDGAQVAGADPVVDSVVRAASARVATRMAAPVAQVAEALPRRGPQHALGQLLADAARVQGNGDFAAWNNGGIRADVAAGTLTYGGVHEVTPFGNVLARVTLRGRDLAAAAERWVWSGSPGVHVSGLTIDYDPARPRGERVVAVRDARGAPLDPARVYTLIVNDFMLDDPEGTATARAIAQEVLPIRDIDMFAAYLRRLPQPVRGDDAPRIRPTGASR
jgi:2',3'-cyclic-nucleotide 2'-phosphodiesterase (5'-nucleotidase family)